MGLTEQCARRGGKRPGSRAGGMLMTCALASLQGDALRLFSFTVTRCRRGPFRYKDSEAETEHRWGGEGFAKNGGRSKSSLGKGKKTGRITGIVTFHNNGPFTWPSPLWVCIGRSDHELKPMPIRGRVHTSSLVHAPCCGTRNEA